MSNDTRPDRLAEGSRALDHYLESLYQSSSEERMEPVEQEWESDPAMEFPSGEEREGNTLPLQGRERSASLRIQLLELAGLKVGVAVEIVDEILPWPEELNVVTSSSRLLGRLSGPEGEIPVMNLAAMILPARMRKRGQTPRFRQILLVHGRRLGVACHDVGEKVAVEPAAVTWSSPQSSRRWLAGTVSSLGCALLDLSVFAPSPVKNDWLGARK